MKKYKRKFKAAGGGVDLAITAAQGGQDLWQTNSQTMLDRYGYKDQPGKQSYSLIGTSRTRAGSTTGAYTDLSKFTSEPAHKVKSKDFGLLNTLNTIVGMGSALVSGSASSLQGSMNTSKTATDPKSAPEPDANHTYGKGNLPFLNTNKLTDYGKSKGLSDLSETGKSMSSPYVDTPQSGFDKMSGVGTGIIPTGLLNTNADINDKYSVNPTMQSGGKNTDLWNTNKVAYVDSVLNAHKNLDWVKRLYEPNTPDMQVPGKQYRSTHLMADNGEGYVYPTIIRGEDGKLKYLGDKAEDYARKTNTGIQLPKEQGTWFARSKDNTSGYKMGTGVLKQLQGGGKNQKGAVPVEAEGGEVDVHFNNNYDIIDIKPIVGASHEKGGVDVKLPKDHAILNKEQIGRLKGGESLKSIISSLPDVKNIGKARPGAVSDNPDDDVPTWKKWQSILGGQVMTAPPAEPQKTIDVGYAPDDKRNTGYQVLPYPPNEEYEQSLLSGTKPKEATWDDFITPKDQTGKNVVETGLDMSPIDLNDKWSLGRQNAALANMPGDKPSLVNTGFKLPDDTPPKWKFGYPEEKAIGDVFANMLALFQPKPQGVTIPSTHVGTPAMVTPRFMNPKATLAEVGKQINTGVKVLTQSGRSDMVPSLIASGISAANDVGEKFAQINSQADTAALAENAKSSNQFSLTQSGIDSDNASRNAMLELERLKISGAQDTERYRALSNLMYGISDYDKMKQDQQLRDAVRQKLMVDMFMKK